MNIKSVYFDMDGTIADLYSVENWLNKLRAFDASPYVEAAPMVSVEKFQKLVGKLREKNIQTGIISWVSKVSPASYTAAIRRAKLDWLDKVFSVQFDEIHIVKYGAPKHLIPRREHRHGVLVDDNPEICERWRNYGGIAIDGSKANWIDTLMEMCE